jgi:hypothetical protein
MWRIAACGGKPTSQALLLQVVESSIPPGSEPHPTENEPENGKSRGDPINFYISGQASRVSKKSPHKVPENSYHQNDHIIEHRTRLALSRFCSCNRSPIRKGQQICYWMDKSAADENRRRSCLVFSLQGYSLWSRVFPSGPTCTVEFTTDTGGSINVRNLMPNGLEVEIRLPRN